MTHAAQAVEGRNDSGPFGTLVARTYRSLGTTLGDQNPVLGREVLTIMRLRSVKACLLGLPLLLTALVMFVAEIDTSVGSSSAERGAGILSFAVTSALYMVALIGAVLGAQSLSGERQSGTLDLVLATGMTPWQIVAGKTTAVWVVLAVMLLACVPPLGICFVVGGVSLGQFAAALLTVLALALVPVSIGVCLGAAQKSSRLAVGSSVVIVGFVAPAVFSVLWIATLTAIGVNTHGSDWPFHFPATITDPWRLLVGGVLLPAYLVVIPSWLLLSIAVHSLTSPAVDRVRSLRPWLLVSGPSGALLAGALALATDIEDAGALFILGCLGAVLSVGTLTMASHELPRRLSGTGFSFFTKPGPNPGAALSVAVSAVSLLIAVAFLEPYAGVLVFFEAAILLTFILCLAGGGVFFASILKPRIARLSVAGLGMVVLVAPLIAAVFLEITFGHHLMSEDPFINLSPVGAYFEVAAEGHGFRRTAMPLLSIVTWASVGLSFWIIGAARLRARLFASRLDSEQ